MCSYLCKKTCKGKEKKCSGRRCVLQAMREIAGSEKVMNRRVGLIWRWGLYSSREEDSLHSVKVIRMIGQLVDAWSWARSPAKCTVLRPRCFLFSLTVLCYSYCILGEWSLQYAPNRWSYAGPAWHPAALWWESICPVALFQSNTCTPFFFGLFNGHYLNTKLNKALRGSLKSKSFVKSIGFKFLHDTLTFSELSFPCP